MDSGASNDKRSISAVVSILKEVIVGLDLVLSRTLLDVDAKVGGDVGANGGSIVLDALISPKVVANIAAMGSRKLGGCTGIGGGIGGGSSVCICVLDLFPSRNKRVLDFDLDFDVEDDM